MAMQQRLVVTGQPCLAQHLESESRVCTYTLFYWECSIQTRNHYWALETPPLHPLATVTMHNHHIILRSDKVRNHIIKALDIKYYNHIIQSVLMLHCTKWHQTYSIVVGFTRGDVSATPSQSVIQNITQSYLKWGAVIDYRCCCNNMICWIVF